MAPMRTFELRAHTPNGAAFVEAAERFATEFTDGALAHDRDGTFATEHLDKLRADGFLVAPIPSMLGGGGVMSVHDVLVGASRLARGDAATAIGVNMHLGIVLNVVRQWQIYCSRDDAAKAAATAASLRAIVELDLVMSAPVSEPSPQDLGRPSTTARRVDGGWVVNGRKAFATMSPHATLMNVAVTYVGEDGTERYGFALIPPGAPGVEFHHDWDALGMRASDSGSVSFHDVRLGADALRDGFPIGAFSAPMLERFLVSGAFHAAASLGIAESAHARIVETLSGRAATTLDDPHAVMRLAENVVDLSAMRATFDRAAALIDEHFAEFATGTPPTTAAQAMFAEVQAAKALLNEAGSRVVDRALALSGGAGFMARNPLAKAWRDARAGAFMHPLGANRAYDFIARVALGAEPR